MRSKLRGAAVAVIGAAALVSGALSGVQPAGAQVSPTVVVFPIDDHVNGWGWADGSTIALGIDDPGTPASPDYADSTVAHPNSFEFFDFNFALAGVFDVQAGQIVTLSDGVTTKTYTVTELTVTDVDPDADTVSGTAAPGSTVDVGLHLSNGSRHVPADGSGNWTVDFSTPGGPTPDEQVLYDIQPGAPGGHANQGNGDGVTRVLWEAPAAPVTTATVEGVVLDGAGQVPGPSVGAVACPGESIPGPGVPPSPPCVFGFANAAGQYTISDLEPGVWTIGAFASAGTALVGAGTPQTLDLPAGTTPGIDFVFGGRIQGTVTDPGGDPVAGVMVQLVSGGVTGGDLTTTGATGEYTTPYLGVATYGLRFIGPDGFVVAEESVAVGPDETVTHDVELQLGWKLQGSVLGDAGPLPDTGAALCPGTGGVAIGCDGFRVAFADGGGNFVIPGVAAGTYSVVGFQLGDPVITSPNLVITTAPGDIVTCAFTIGTNPSSTCTGIDATVQGTVFDGAGQVPGPTAGAVACPGEWVFAPGVPPSPPCVFGFANATGEYTISGLEPGVWTIGAFGTAGGALVGAGTPQTLDLPAGTTSGIDFVFGSRVQGVVTSSGGDPVADVTVELVSGGVSGGVLTATLAGGDYTTPYLGAGTYGLRFIGPDGLSFAEASVTLGVDETLTRDVQLQVGSKLEGSVLGDGGVPGSGAAICPGTGGVSLGCEGFRIAPADAGGNFVMPGVAAGTYSVVGFQFGDPVVTSPHLVITTAPGDIVTCAFTIGADPSSACSGAASGDSVAAEAGAGDTVTTDTAGTGATEEDPVQADVTTPNEGTVTIVEEAPPPPDPDEWPPIGEEQLNISAPEATTSDPLVLVFRIDASEIVGLELDRIEVIKDGAVVLDCTGTPGHAEPDPCVSNRVLLEDGDAEITVLSSTASLWRFAYSPFDFDGFSAPVNNLPTLNSVKAGRAIPVKFSLGGDVGLDVFAEGYPKSQQITCNDDVSSDGIEETVNSGQSSLSYDAATDTYTYVWKTDSDWSDTCRQLVLKLADGAVHRANFEFK